MKLLLKFTLIFIAFMPFMAYAAEPSRNNNDMESNATNTLYNLRGQAVDPDSPEVVILGMQASESEKADWKPEDMLVRLSVIEVYPEYLDEYIAAAAKIGATSVEKEPGVICIYPMTEQRDKCQVRILEIYRDEQAYRDHIASEHFQTYKQGTLHMVKNLDLVDMDPMDPEAMPLIFKKMQLWTK